MRDQQRQLIKSRYNKIQHYTELLLSVMDDLEFYSSPHMSKEDYEAFRHIDYNARQIEQLLEAISHRIEQVCDKGEPTA